MTTPEFNLIAGNACKAPAVDGEQLFGLAARPIRSLERESLLMQMRHDIDLPELQAGNLWMHEVVLPFYRDYRLYQLQNFDMPYPEMTRVLYKPGSLHVLDWSNEPIYAVNELAPIRIKETTVQAYLRFFFSSVCARIGGFRIVEKPSDVPWLGNGGEVERAQVESLLVPMTVAGIDASGIYTVPATVLFKHGLFTVDLKVASRETDLTNEEEKTIEHMSIGQVAMHGEELVVEDLDVHDYMLPTSPQRSIPEIDAHPEPEAPTTDPQWMN